VNSSVTVRDCIIQNTKSGVGVVTSGSVRLVSCVLAGSTKHGLFATGSASATLVNCTITDNATTGIVWWSTGRATVTNSILWDNGDDVSGTPSRFTVTYSDIGDGDFAGGAGNIAANPHFLDAVGGDWRLAPTSLCIDAATSTGAPSLDLAGNARRDEPAIPNAGAGTLPYYDLGAYEYTP
jgi:parallel beta-helix repeat protein